MPTTHIFGCSVFHADCCNLSVIDAWAMLVHVSYFLQDEKLLPVGSPLEIHRVFGATLHFRLIIS